MSPTRLLIASMPFLLAGCGMGYDPPMRADHASAKYRDDLVRCRKQASSAAEKKANATPQSAVLAVFASDEPVRQDIRACMEKRGYTAP